MIAILLTLACLVLVGIGYGIGYSVANRELEDELAEKEDELERMHRYKKDFLAERRAKTIHGRN